MAAMARFRRHLAVVEKVMGGLLVLTGVAFLTGWVSDAGFWLLEWFPAFGPERLWVRLTLPWRGGPGGRVGALLRAGVG